MQNFLLIMLFFISFFAFLYQLFTLNSRQGSDVLQRLNKLVLENGHDIPQDELNQSFTERIFKPAMERLGKTLMKLTPHEKINTLEKMIVMAGKPYGWSVKNWLTLQAFIIVGLPFAVFVLYLQLKVNMQMSMITVLSLSIAGFLFPKMSLNGKIRKRQSEVMRSLPDIMDLLTVSVEAGLTFDAALSKVVEKMPGAIAREFETVLQEMKVGKSKKDALYQMADRVGVLDLRSFVSAIVQADQLGVSLGRVLRIQSEQIRQNRKQRIQEKAMKAPIKMLIPMIVFIFPVIFIVLLGPVVINLIKMLS